MSGIAGAWRAFPLQEGERAPVLLFSDELKALPPMSPARNTILFAAFATSLAGPALAQTEPRPSEKWMAHCAKNLEGEGIAFAIVRKYCLCMGEVGEEAEMLTWSQGELERAYPPAHKICHIEARKP